MEIIKTTTIELPVIIAVCSIGKIDGVTQFIFKDRLKSDFDYRNLPLFDFIADLLKEYKNKYE